MRTEWRTALRRRSGRPPKRSLRGNRQCSEGSRGHASLLRKLAFGPRKFAEQTRATSSGRGLGAELSSDSSPDVAVDRHLDAALIRADVRRMIRNPLDRHAEPAGKRVEQRVSFTPG